MFCSFDAPHLLFCKLYLPSGLPAFIFTRAQCASALSMSVCIVLSDEGRFSMINGQAFTLQLLRSDVVA